MRVLHITPVDSPYLQRPPDLDRDADARLTVFAARDRGEYDRAVRTEDELDGKPSRTRVAVESRDPLPVCSTKTNSPFGTKSAPVPRLNSGGAPIASKRASASAPVWGGCQPSVAKLSRGPAVRTGAGSARGASAWGASVPGMVSGSARGASAWGVSVLGMVSGSARGASAWGVSVLGMVSGSARGASAWGVPVLGMVSGSARGASAWGVSVLGMVSGSARGASAWGVPVLGMVSGSARGASAWGVSVLGMVSGSARGASAWGVSVPGMVSGSARGASAWGVSVLGIVSGSARGASAWGVSVPDIVSGSARGASALGVSVSASGSGSAPVRGFIPSAASVASSVRPVAGNPTERWNCLSAPRVRHPMAPSIAPGSYPLSTSVRWIASTIGSGAA